MNADAESLMNLVHSPGWALVHKWLLTQIETSLTSATHTLNPTEMTQHLAVYATLKRLKDLPDSLIQAYRRGEK